MPDETAAWPDCTPEKAVEAVKAVRAATAIAADLQHENERLRRALNDIVNASRDEGMAKMILWMRGRAMAALGGE
jgi:hypothetical protein